MNDMRNGRLGWQAEAVYRARVRGCLLGGAIGDALGYPIEFDSLDRIRAAHGPRGVTGLVPDGDGVVGRVSDDTQMTLFTVEGLQQAHARERLKGIGGGWPRLVRWAYGRWLDTQTQPGPAADVHGGLAAQSWLYARRAPGNACLRAPGAGPRSRPDDRARPARTRQPRLQGVRDRDALGTLRAGPHLGRLRLRHGRAVRPDDPRTPHRVLRRRSARRDRRPSGRRGVPGERRAARPAAAGPPPRARGDHRRPDQGPRLAAEGAPTAEKLESLGAGWIAEEALAMGVYSALATPDVTDALLLSVNHSGDSDSTGSICGNLLGARHGDHGLPQEWLERIEGRATITVLADDFAAECVRR